MGFGGHRPSGRETDPDPHALSGDAFAPRVDGAEDHGPERRAHGRALRIALRHEHLSRRPQDEDGLGRHRAVGRAGIVAVGGRRAHDEARRSRRDPTAGRQPDDEVRAVAGDDLRPDAAHEDRVLRRRHREARPANGDLGRRLEVAAALLPAPARGPLAGGRGGRRGQVLAGGVRSTPLGLRPGALDASRRHLGEGRGGAARGFGERRLRGRRFDGTGRCREERVEPGHVGDAIGVLLGRAVSRPHRDPAVEDGAPQADPERAVPRLAQVGGGRSGADPGHVEQMRACFSREVLELGHVHQKADAVGAQLAVGEEVPLREGQTALSALGEEEMPHPLERPAEGGRQALGFRCVAEGDLLAVVHGDRAAGRLEGLLAGTLRPGAAGGAGRDDGQGRPPPPSFPHRPPPSRGAPRPRGPRIRCAASGGV